MDMKKLKISYWEDSKCSIPFSKFNMKCDEGLQEVEEVFYLRNDEGRRIFDMTYESSPDFEMFLEPFPFSMNPGEVVRLVLTIFINPKNKDSWTFKVPLISASAGVK